MTIFKRGKVYHYRVSVDGVVQRGSTGATNKKDALAFEERIRGEYENASKNQKKVLLDGDGAKGPGKLDMPGLWKLFIMAPSYRKTTKDDIIRAYWTDWCEFIAEVHPSSKVHNCPKRFAEDYSRYLQDHGRFSPKSNASGKKLAGNTINAIIGSCRRVYQAYVDHFGLDPRMNPFDGIKPIKKGEEPREAFTVEELRIIGEKAEGWIKHLFVVGLYTGLREGDICLLRWKDVDMKARWITVKMSKTKKTVEIPIVAPLYSHLEKLREKAGNAVMPSFYLNTYLSDTYNDKSKRGTIGSDVEWFLRERCGIVTSEKLENRTRVVKRKDVHSLRHTFVYLAAINGIPLPIVQNIVGHVSGDMTAKYARHAIRDDVARHMTAAFDSEDISEKPENRQVYPEDSRERWTVTLSNGSRVVLPPEKYRELEVIYQKQQKQQGV